DPGHIGDEHAERDIGGRPRLPGADHLRQERDGGEHRRDHAGKRHKCHMSSPLCLWPCYHACRRVTGNRAMRNGEVAGIVVATTVLLWIVSGIALIPVVAALFIGWYDHFRFEFALECATIALIAGIVLHSQERLYDTPALWAWGAILVVLADAVQGIALA